MKKHKWIGVIIGVVALLLIVGVFLKGVIFNEGIDKGKQLSVIESSSLGNLCSGEECKEYCSANFDECIAYCEENPSNILCQEISLFEEKEIRQSPKRNFRFGQNFPSCDDRKELFTVSHIPISNLQNIIPLGNLNPSGHTFPTNHLYFHLKGFTGGGSESYAPVVAPGDFFITRIGSSEYIFKGRDVTDYKLDFVVCEEVRGYFIHLTSLSEKLLQNLGQPSNCEEYGTGGIDYKNCEKDFYSNPISLKVGESIGTAGGSSDFGLADFRTPKLQYANPSRWYDEPLHRVCPLDYYTPEIKYQSYSLLGDSSNKRIIQPLCGEVEQDEPGTAQGVWFVKGTTNTYPEDPHLALVHDNINPSKGAFSVGTSMSKSGLLTGVYFFTPKNSGFVNRDFKDVTSDGNIYCYETQRRFESTSFVIYIQLNTLATLRIEAKQGSSCGSGLWTLGSSSTEFER